MQRLIFVITLACVLGISATSVALTYHQSPAQEAVIQNETTRPAKPSFVLIEYNPWAMVIGSDSPTFALYDDGTVIYWKTEGRRGKYLSAKLTNQEVSQILEKVNPQSFGSLNKRYEPAAGISDAPEYLIVLQRSDGSYQGVSIYGSLRGSNGAVTESRKVPQVLIDVFQFASTYDNPKATAWLPDFIEVMIWPYEYAPDKNLVWPKGWPTLNDPKTIKRGDGYSLFIEKSQYGELIAFLSKRREKQAVQIDGKKWAISVRFPFPGESTWSGIK